MICNMKSDKPVDRLFSEMARINMSITALADKLGFPETSRISNWRKRDIPEAMLADVAYAIGVTVDWLITGEGDKKNLGALERDLAFDNVFIENYKARTDRSVLKLLKKGLIEIPVYDIEAAGGHGAFIHAEKVEGHLRINLKWARQNIGQITGSLAIIYVSGDSMEPTFHPGDMIVVDHMPINSGQLIDGVHVLRIDDRLYIKRLQALPNKRIKVISDNTSYESFELDRNTDFQILGRVKWSWQGKRF